MSIRLKHDIRYALFLSVFTFLTLCSVHAQTDDADADLQRAVAAQEVAAQEEEPSEETADGKTRKDAGKSAVRLLRDADPQQRQRGAEALARLAASEHLPLVHGYRLQERDARVRLALDWALYRLGKPESLFGVVGALDTRHREQAIEYLARLDEPTTLIALLRSPKREVKTGVLEALGRNGDDRSVKAIEPLVASSDLSIAAAAQLALTQIEMRQEKKSAAPEAPMRPRQIAKPPQGDDQD